jgi:hypothetical protein
VRHPRPRLLPEAGGGSSLAGHCARAASRGRSRGPRGGGGDVGSGGHPGAEEGDLR